MQMKKEPCEDKAIPKNENENKRSIDITGDAEKSVLVSGNGNIIHIHTHESVDEEKIEPEIITGNKPSRIKNSFKMRIWLTSIIVLLLLMAVFRFVISPKFIKPDLPLRNTPITVSTDDALKTLKLKKHKGLLRPLEYIHNDFKDNWDGTITDRATGLMWQKSGSPDDMLYNDVPTYIDRLNREKFAGHNDWRLPTIDELKSLLTPDEQSNDCYINPIFGNVRGWWWTSDQLVSGGTWHVYFPSGSVDVSRGNDNYHSVRAVRSAQ